MNLFRVFSHLQSSKTSPNKSILLLWHIDEALHKTKCNARFSKCKTFLLLKNKWMRFKYCKAFVTRYSTATRHREPRLVDRGLTATVTTTAKNQPWVSTRFYLSNSNRRHGADTRSTNYAVDKLT